MNRRRVLQSLGAGALALPLMGVAGEADEPTVTPPVPGASTTGQASVLDGNGLLGGRTLQQLHDRYIFDLFEDFVPLMERHVIDHQLGGFMCNARRDGSHIDTNKSATYDGRGTWTFSYLAKTLAPEEKYLDVARKTVEFILRNQPRGELLWPLTYTREGAPLSPPGDHTEPIYRDLFIAEGLAVYGQVTDQEEYWLHGKRIIQKALRLYDRDDYAPTKPFGYVRGAMEPPQPLPGCRILGVPMVLIRTTSQMLEYRDDPEVKAIADRCLDEILGPFVNLEYTLMNEVLNHDMSLPDNAYGAVAYTGHAQETLWMVMYEAHRRQDRGLFSIAAEMLRRHVEVSWDYVYGGWFRGCQDVDRNVWFLDKSAWVQEETLIGLLYVIEHTGAQWAKEWYRRAYSFVIDKYPLARHGYSGWDDYPDRKITFVEEYNRLENFHHPRHLMLGLETIKRMMARDARISADMA